MNENLKRLQELVKETNQVVANLAKETESIEDANNLIRASKFREIRDFLFECYDIVKDLRAVVLIPINIPDTKKIDHEATVYIQIGLSEKDPVRILLSYFDNRGDLSYSEGHTFKRDMEWKPENKKQYFFSCHFTVQNEYDFVDKWDQAGFEKEFATQIESVITEKANKANAKYQDAIDRAKIIREH